MKVSNQRKTMRSRLRSALHATTRPTADPILFSNCFTFLQPALCVNGGSLGKVHHELSDVGSRIKQSRLLWQGMRRRTQGFKRWLQGIIWRMQAIEVRERSAGRGPAIATSAWRVFGLLVRLIQGVEALQQHQASKSMPRCMGAVVKLAVQRGQEGCEGGGGCRILHTLVAG